MKRLILNPDNVKVGNVVHINWTQIEVSYVKKRLFRSNIVVFKVYENIVVEPKELNKSE